MRAAPSSTSTTSTATSQGVRGGRSGACALSSSIHARRAEAVVEWLCPDTTTRPPGSSRGTDRAVCGPCVGGSDRPTDADPHQRMAAHSGTPRSLDNRSVVSVGRVLAQVLKVCLRRWGHWPVGHASSEVLFCGPAEVLAHFAIEFSLGMRLLSTFRSSWSAVAAIR